jgi:hypothetical protein
MLPIIMPPPIQEPFETCPICLQPLSYNLNSLRPLFLTCGHLMCTKCFYECENKNISKCMICRRGLVIGSSIDFCKYNTQKELPNILDLTMCNIHKGEKIVNYCIIHSIDLCKLCFDLHVLKECFFCHGTSKRSTLRRVKDISSKQNELRKLKWDRDWKLFWYEFKHLGNCIDHYEVLEKKIKDHKEVADKSRKIIMGKYYESEKIYFKSLEFELEQSVIDGKPLPSASKGLPLEKIAAELFQVQLVFCLELEKLTTSLRQKVPFEL